MRATALMNKLKLCLRRAAALSIIAAMFAGACILPGSAYEIPDEDYGKVDGTTAKVETETTAKATTTTKPSATTAKVEESSVAEEESSTENTPEEESSIAEYKELESQYEALEQEMEENKEKLDKVQQDLGKQEVVVDNIYGKMDATQTEIDGLTYQINLLRVDISNTTSQIQVISKQLGSLSDQIAETQTAMGQKREQLDTTYELLKQRIRAMYMSGSGSMLEFLLTSEDFATLMNRTELLVRVAEHDNDLMATLESDISELQTLETKLQASVDTQTNKKTALTEKNASLAEKEDEIESANSKLEKKQQELSAQHDQAKAELDALDKESDEYKALISKQEDELIAISNQMEQFIKDVGSSTSDGTAEDEEEEKEEDDDKSNSSNPYLDGSETVFSSGMIFPLKVSGVYISSPYGMRTHPTTGEYKLHTGTDFSASGINGKTVYAVKDGEVIYAQKHKAYGNFVIIDHGKGVSTCYAHMQDYSMLVKVGDKVKQGQPIGKVGSTGYSNGPHLHFEVRIDGATTNPMNGYIKLPK